MKPNLFALTTVACLVACGTDKRAAGDAAKADTMPAAAAVAQKAADSVAAAPTPAKNTAVVPPANTKAVVPRANTKASVPPATNKQVEPPPVAKPVVPPAVPPVTPPVTPPATKQAAPPPAAAPSAPAIDPQTGKPLYEENCRKCHGNAGVPPRAMQAKFPKLMTFDAAFFSKRTDDSVVKVLTNGKDEDMTSFKGKLSTAEMGAVAAYIRTFAKK